MFTHTRGLGSWWLTDPQPSDHRMSALTLASQQPDFGLSSIQRLGRDIVLNDLPALLFFLSRLRLLDSFFFLLLSRLRLRDRFLSSLPRSDFFASFLSSSHEGHWVQALDSDRCMKHDLESGCSYVRFESLRRGLPTPIPWPADP
jgi:hypothetical protein